MRKSFLQNEKKEAQRKKVIVIVIGVLLIGIMAFSSVSYFADPAATGGVGSFKEYGQTFTPIQTDQGQTYRTKIGGTLRDFIYLPTQVSYVNVSDDAKQILPLVSQLQTVVLAVSPNSEFGMLTFQAASLILGDLYDEKRQILPAITAENASITSQSAIPVISCDNQSYFAPQNLSGQIPIIQVQEANQTGIRLQENCIIVEGSDGAGILSAVERLRYGIWGLDFTKEAVDVQ